jgi:DNA adenine methylase
VNSKGQNNVPFGKYKDPKICDIETLHSCSSILQHASIHNYSYSHIEQNVKSGDLIYLDPPYVPLNKTSNFTSYNSNNFGDNEQIALRDFVKKMTDRNVFVIQSNSYCDRVLDLYKDFNIHEIYASRVLNSKSENRGKISETLITNF